MLTQDAVTERVWRGPGVDPGEPPDGKPRVAIDASEDPIVAALAYGKDVLEIGTGLGYSTLAMSKTAKMVVTIDSDPWVAKKVAPRLPTNVIFRKAWPPWWRHEWYDMVFVDADPRPDSVMSDLRRAVTVVPPFGLIVWHDWREASVRDTVLSACGREAVVLEAPTRYGIGVVIATESIRAALASPEDERW